MAALTEVLSPLSRLAVLYSGGIDSEVLLHAAAEHLGSDSVLALTSDTCFLAEDYRIRIPEVCRKLRVRYVPVTWNPLQYDRIVSNSPMRCYHCKKAVYTRLSSEAYRLGFSLVADGTSMDDQGEDRPGLRAAGEENILHPLVAAGMGKREVRELGRELGVDHPDRPHDSCLATRISRGVALTSEALILVEKLEAPIRLHAGGRFRARLKPDGILLEYTDPDTHLLEEHLDDIREAAAAAGFKVSTVLIPDNPG